MTSTQVLEQDAHRRLHVLIVMHLRIISEEIFAIFANDAPLCTIGIVIGLAFARAHAQVGPISRLLIVDKQSRLDLAVGCELNQESLLVWTGLLMIFVTLSSGQHGRVDSPEDPLCPILSDRLLAGGGPDDLHAPICPRLMFNHEHFITSAIHNFNAVLLQAEEDISLAHVLHFVVAISQCLHGRPVLQLVLIGLLRGHKWLGVGDFGLVEVVEGQVAVAADRHLVGARRIDNHLFLFFVPLVAQDYPFKKWVIDELQDYLRVQIRLIWALRVLHSDLIG
jgi:hypothetical protein